MPRLPFRRRPSPEPPDAPPPTDPSYDAFDPEDGHELRMSLWAHLGELRDRLLRVLIALMLGSVLGFIVAGDVIDFLRGPYCALVEAEENCRFIILGPTGGIVAYLRVSILVGAALGIPYITYQVMMFVLPGLKKHERRYVLLALPAITLLFGVGVLFAWFVLMPPALGFLEGFQPTLFSPEWTADLYLTFVTTLVFWMGVAFQTPLIFFILALLGLVTAGGLARNWRVAIVGASVAAALITPTIDPVNMFLVMAPLLALYLFSILLVMLGRRIAFGRNQAAAPA